MFRRMLVATAGLALMAGSAMAQDFYDPSVTVQIQTENDTLPLELRMTQPQQPLILVDPLSTAAIPTPAPAQRPVGPGFDNGEVLGQVGMYGEVDTTTTASVGTADPGATIQPDSEQDTLPENLANSQECEVTASGQTVCMDPSLYR